MSFMRWALSDLAAALGEQLVAAPECRLEGDLRLVQTDSRSVASGDLFVCLKGERFDAHHFVDQVAEQGAIGLIVSRSVSSKLPQWVVKDTRMALGQLAKAWRERFKLTMLAVVGSNGKTTSKEMLASICKAQFGEDQVLVTQGNLNNEIGVPQTLLRLREEHKLAIAEMGMNHPGEIEYLSALVQPDVVLMTNAQREHQEFMKSVLAVAEENGQAFKALSQAGCAVFPANTEFEALWNDLAEGRVIHRFGEQGEVSVSADQKKNGELCVSSPQGRCTFKPHFLGKHNLSNAAGAAAAAMAAGCSLTAVQKGLEAFRPVWGRMEVVLNTPRLLLVNDAYNANPDSVNAAIDVLAEQEGQTLLVLGDMGEVGDQSTLYHREVGEHAKRAGLNCLYALGQEARLSAEAFGAQAQHFDSVDALSAAVIALAAKGNWTILVKGSRFMKMERVVQAIESSTLNPQGESHAS